MKESQLERDFAALIKLYNLPEPEREYRFMDTRRFRFDFAWPAQKIAAECEGGAFIQGRHTRGAGFESDCRKYNSAIALGWRVLRFTRSMVRSFEAIRTLQGVFETNMSCA